MPSSAIAVRRRDLRQALPVALIGLIALAAWPATGSTSTWITLTVAGLAMGMIVFIAASGLTLVFGLMDVLNFGHSVFIALGAYVATSVLVAVSPHGRARPACCRRSAPCCWRCWRRMALGGAVGLGFERVDRPAGLRPAPQADPRHARRRHRRRGADQGRLGPGRRSRCRLPEALRGSLRLGDASVETFRLVAVAIGLVVLAGAALDAEPHQARPADPRRRAGPRDGRRASATGSGASSSPCSRPARRWPASAAACGA